MKPQEFISQYKEFFGEAAPLPIAVAYTEKPLSEIKAVPECMFKQFHRAFNGTTISLDAENLTCGGGKAYTGLAPLPERVYSFVSNIEKYKDSPATTQTCIESVGPKLSDKPYINFIRIDSLGSFDRIEGLIFFVNPDILSGLFAWANYDTRDINAVRSPWGSGCSSTVTALVNENRNGGKHCFIGLLDVSARPFFRSDIMSFSIPKSRLDEMLLTLSNCCVADSQAWNKIKKRINH